MSVRRTAMGQRNRLLDCMPATSILLVLMMVIPVRAQEDAARVDVSAADNAAAVYSASNFFYHVLPSATPAGKMGAASHNFGVSKPASVTATLSATATIPRVPAPGFYGEDLKYFGGHVLKTVTSNNIYVNESSCGGSVASC